MSGPDWLLRILDELLDPEGTRSVLLVLIVAMVSLSFWRSE